MGKGILLKPATRDDPIYKEGFQIFTPRSPRSSTPSTESSPKRQDKGSGRASKGKAQKAPPSNPEEQ